MTKRSVTMPCTSRNLTIFEGPDGSGKTTAALEFAELTGAKYVHFGPLPHVKSGLARMYVEAMMPALLGYQDVVFDRSWLSEVPYGSAFRGGADRLGDAQRRMLERLAYRCGAVVVKCQPSWSIVKSNYFTRRDKEYLKNEAQLRHVYEVYKSQTTSLPSVDFNHWRGDTVKTLINETNELRTRCHDLDLSTAGNSEARFVLVGESFAERKNQDSWYQWPFASFNDGGCSNWLTDTLEKSHISESLLYWVNSDQDLKKVEQNKVFIALGLDASQALDAIGINHKLCPHPQYWKRFHSGQQYPLITVLKEYTCGI